MLTEGIPTATNPEKARTTKITKVRFIPDMIFDVPKARVPPIVEVNAMGPNLGMFIKYLY
jgi:hypothetical protein